MNDFERFRKETDDAIRTLVDIVVRLQDEISVLKDKAPPRREGIKEEIAAIPKLKLPPADALRNWRMSSS